MHFPAYAPVRVMRTRFLTTLIQSNQKTARIKNAVQNQYSIQMHNYKEFIVTVTVELKDINGCLVNSAIKFLLHRIMLKNSILYFYHFNCTQNH